MSRWVFSHNNCFGSVFLFKQLTLVMASFYIIMFVVPVLIIGLAAALSYRIKFRDDG